MKYFLKEEGNFAGLPGAALAKAMPQADTVIFTSELTTPAGNTISVTKTLELDEYEYKKKSLDSRSAIFMANAAVLANTSDTFAGTARKASKLSIVPGEPEKFADLNDLIKTLPLHKAMVNHTPKITTKADSKRVSEEMRSVKVEAFLYAASREDDNDFHLIIGRDPKESTKVFMTMEISGLPSQNAVPFDKKTFDTLKSARDAYKDFFKNNLPGLGYDFYPDPIPITITGSLFFDMSHATGSRPGPSKLRPFMPVVWEVHPVTEIKFKI